MLFFLKVSLFPPKHSNLVISDRSKPFSLREKFFLRALGNSCGCLASVISFVNGVKSTKKSLDLSIGTLIFSIS